MCHIWEGLDSNTIIDVDHYAYNIVGLSPIPMLRERDRERERQRERERERETERERENERI